jgi:anti-repressor protein
VTNIQIFNNSKFGVIRTIEESGKVLFCGNDVAKALGYVDAPKAVKQHCKEDGWAIYPVIDNLGRKQQARFINEGNLYRLIANSKLPSAQEFEVWVFD